ncbi:protein XRI1-like [Salvia hispanica]|uniref:protein XRI1-like n=1 Tax=Salvia hispanica TaxID=49212 RepID=UPI002009764F|nr:protein XRI1-like [Salvia hispanica]XP_047956397.1 protein XRI1-like [Salvia hispanica]
MSYNNNGSDMWGWRNQVYSLEDNTSIEASKSPMNEVEHNVDHISYMFDNETTPVKACGDLPYYVSNNGTSGKESELYRDHSSQVKRRRMLQFESEVLETPICNDEEFLRSKETEQSLEAAISDMSEWVAGFTTSDECLDPSSEGWMADCFNDPGMHLCNEDFNSACGGASDVQIDVTELCNTAPTYEVKNNLSISTPRNVVFKGTKSYMRTPPKPASSVIYPFTFIKPCSLLGHTTLQDINQRIHNPPKPKPAEDEYPTSAFSGKPVVGKTKIHTEGGKGSITIMRTKG